MNTLTFARCATAFAIGCATSLALAAADNPSIARGRYLTRTSGCNDCHTPGYAEANGKLDEKAWLKGNPIGYFGPWGTTYAVNLRYFIKDMSEDQFVQHLKTFKTRPIMPWYDVQLLPETDTRSLYRFIKSLGEPGDPMPAALPPGQMPKTPYVVEAPPQMPQMPR